MDGGPRQLIGFRRGRRESVLCSEVDDARIKDQNVFMPPFGLAYSDAELAAVANYVIAHFGGRAGRVTPEDVAMRWRE